MSKEKAKSSVKKTDLFRIYWERKNWILFFIGIALLFLGYFLMSFGPFDNPVSLTISPLVLLIAYIVVFPLAILIKNKKN